LTDFLAAAQLGQTGGVDLYLPGSQTLSVGDTSLVKADPDTLARLQTSNLADYVQFAYEGVPSLVSQAPVRAISGEPEIANLGWTVVVYQDEAEALAPVEAQTRAGLLLALVIVGLAAAGAVGLAQLLTGPITRLTDVARRVTEGDLTARAEAKSKDEIGQLATAFNSMTGRLQETIDTLEVKVVGRTRQLETVVEVSQRLAGILDLGDLLRQVVILTAETFEYYHAHIYLLEGETLLMAQGYGEAGAEMRRQGHKIPLAAPRSLVARAAREGRVFSVENVRQEPDWLPNPLLPDTHAEMAVPVMVGSEVVGVLDVQSDKVGGLTTEDEGTLQVLANQVAIAVRNARLFAQTQEALYEAQRLQRLYTGEAWDQFRAARRTTDYEFREATVPPLQEVPTPEAATALEQEQTVDFRFPIGDFGLESTEGESAKDTQSKTLPGAGERNPKPAGQVSKMGAALATPLKLRDEVIGVLGIHDENPERRWSEEEIALIEAVSEQMSLAVENARLFEHTQRDAWRNQVVSETTAKVWASSEIEAVMRTAVAELGEKLQASEVVIRLGTEGQ
jgi:GAF domain-containing protein/HAMP domain-containing protein